jgi:serine/threonine protein kinase
MLSKRPLAKLITETCNDNSYSFLTERVNNIIDGGCRSNRIYEVAGVVTQSPESGDQLNKLIVVISQPKEIPVAPENEVNPDTQTRLYCREWQIKDALQAQNLLQLNQVPHDFIQEYLYYNDRGLVCTEYTSHSELFAWLVDHQRTFECVKNFMGQLLLGLHDLHSRNLVHRDIKPENILMYERRSGLILNYADLDTIIKVNDDGTQCLVTNPDPFPNYTEGYTPPEYFNIPHILLNRKAVDCYALGTLFYHFLTNSLQPAEEAKLIVIENGGIHSVSNQGSYFISLVLQLRELDVEKRITVEMAMENKIFGETASERYEFFSALRENSKHAILFDTFKYPANVYNNNFLLLDKYIKFLIYYIGKIDKALIECEQELLAKPTLNAKEIASFSQFLENIYGLENQFLSTITLMQTSSPELYNYFIETVTLFKNVVHSEIFKLSNALEKKCLLSILNNSFDEYNQICHDNRYTLWLHSPSAEKVKMHRMKEDLEIYINASMDNVISFQAIYNFVIGFGIPEILRKSIVTQMENFLNKTLQEFAAGIKAVEKEVVWAAPKLF